MVKVVRELPAFVAAIDTLGGILAETLGGTLLWAWSSGRLGARLSREPLCRGQKHAGVVVPLRADTGWVERFVTDVPAGVNARAPNDVSFRASARPSRPRTEEGLCWPSWQLEKTAPITTCE